MTHVAPGRPQIHYVAKVGLELLVLLLLPPECWDGRRAPLCFIYAMVRTGTQGLVHAMQTFFPRSYMPSHGHMCDKRPCGRRDPHTDTIHSGASHTLYCVSRHIWTLGDTVSLWHFPEGDMGQEIGRENYDLNDVGQECFYHTSAGQREMCSPCYSKVLCL